MSPALLTLLTFVSGVLAVFGVYSILSDLFLRDRSRVNKRLDEEFRKKQRERARKASLFKNLGQLASDAAAEDRAERGPRRRFEAMVAQSGLDLTPQKLLAIAGGVGLAVGALAGLLRQSVLIGAAAALAGASVPVFYVYVKRNLRVEKMLTQLPDAFDLMARVIRAGQTMSQGLQAVADEFEAPIAAEFAYCYEQQNLGLPPEVALRDLARRTGLLEIKIFVLAVLVQQQTGGNIAELLEKLAAVVRDRFRVRGKIKAMTAEGRLQAIILLVLPPVMFLVILMLNRNYGRTLLAYPNLLLGMFFFEVVGALWIRRIIHFDY